MSPLWRRHRGRLEVEIVQGCAAGITAFVLAALVGEAAGDRVALAVLGIFLSMSVLVGVITMRFHRRAATSEEARDVIAEEQAALRRVATLVARQPSPGEVFAAVTEEVGRLLQVDAAAMLVNDGDGTGTVVGVWGRQGVHPPVVEQQGLAVGMRLALERDTAAGRALRTRRPERIEDHTRAESNTAKYVRSLGIRSAVGTPILVEGRVWGLMIAASVGPQPLSPGTELRMEAFTELVATALVNAEARKELERVAAEQAAHGRVATLVAEAAPSAEIFDAVAREVSGLFAGTLVTLSRYEPDGSATAIAAAGFGVDAAAAQAVDLPVLVGGRVWGAVTLARAEGQPSLPEETVERMNAFTDLVATAIANAAARIEIEKLAEVQSALRRVATLVARGAEAGAVLAAVAAEVGRALDADHTCLFRYEANAAATVVAAWGDDCLPAGSTWPLYEESVVASVFHTGAPVRVDDLGETSGELAALTRQLGRVSVVGAPIVIEERLWGAAVAGASEVPLPQAAEERISNFAELVATAISNADTRAELTASRARVVAAADETRRRLERDLHDGIQQRLVSLALKARAAELAAGETQDELSFLADDLGAVLDELREISRGIHPAILSEAGLRPALKALARRSPVPVALELHLDSRLEEVVEAAAYYVVSEALTNTVKHAEASMIELRADHRDGALTLVVRDDGVGGAHPGRGSGLLGLTDRVAALGGRITVTSPSGAGTTLVVRIPAKPSPLGALSLASSAR